MIKENLNGLIMSAMKAGDKVRTEALRAVKTAIMNWETAKENVGKHYDEAVEISILRKLTSQYEDAAVQCNDGKHDDLVKFNTDSAMIVKEFLPAPISEDKIIEAFETLMCMYEPIKKNMGLFIKEIKAVYPSADGKLVSQVVGSRLH